MSIRKIRRRTQLLQRASTAIKHLLRQVESIQGRYDEASGALGFDFKLESALVKLR